MNKTTLGLIFALLPISPLLTQCAHSYNQTVSYVDRDRFMGTWYVMAGRFTRFEKNVFNAIEKYAWNEAEQKIEIDFSYNQGSLTGPVKKMPQVGWIVNEQTNATWKIQPFWPLKFTYLIIGLDPNYEWTAIGVPNQNYLWIMSRKPNLTMEKIGEILETIAATRYSIENIVYVQHQAQ